MMLSRFVKCKICQSISLPLLQIFGLQLKNGIIPAAIEPAP